MNTMPPDQVNDLFPTDAENAEALLLRLREYQAKFAHRTVAGILEMGKTLLLLKGAVRYGEYENQLRLLGISRSNVHRLRITATKFFRTSRAWLLKVANNPTKLYLLRLLDDAEVNELVVGGTVRGMTTEEIAKMGVVELSAKLRHGLADKEALLSAKAACMPSKATNAPAPQSATTFLQALLSGSEEKQPSGQVREELGTVTVGTLFAVPGYSQSGKSVHLSEDEAAMLHAYRNCTKEGQALVAQSAKLLAQRPAQVAV